MSHYLLDTDMVSLYQHGHPRVCAAVADHHSTDVVISVLTVEEQLSGWYSELRRAKKKAPILAATYLRMAKTVRFYAMLPIVSFTEPAIARYEDLKGLKIRIGKTDLRIAAIALEHNAVVVTRNVKDFRHVPGLQIEDWSK
jgi:tRNA(fMet)-specific endonuclease VapC